MEISEHKDSTINFDAASKVTLRNLGAWSRISKFDNSFDGLVRWLDMAHATERKAQPVSFDLMYDIQSTDATTNLNVEEDLTSKELVFDWRPALKEEHVLFDLRPWALAIDRKTKLVVFGL
jgi:hypothetical protein